MSEPRKPPHSVRELIALDEGRRRSVYLDSLGFQTIGVGRMVDARKNGGLSDAEIDFLLDNDIALRKLQLDLALPWWRSLDVVRQAVLINMAFQLGTHGLLGFASTLTYVKAHQWDKAADGMRHSVWHAQTPERCERLAEQMRTGQWQ